MEKVIEFYLSLNLNFENSAEICDDFLKPPYCDKTGNIQKNNDFQRHFLKFLVSGKKEDFGKFQRIFWCKK